MMADDVRGEGEPWTMLNLGAGVSSFLYFKLITAATANNVDALHHPFRTGDGILIEN